MSHVPDTIHLNALKLEVAVGFHAVEQGVKQIVVADLTVETDFRSGPQDDRHTGLVDYFDLERTLRTHVAAKSYDLLEALAADLARQVIALHPTARVRVRLTKRPIGMAGLDSVSVECVRVKADFVNAR